MSNYIVDRAPNQYGGLQTDYQEFVKTTISNATIELKSSFESKKDLKQLFFSTLDFLSKKRNEIATLHNTNEYERFGVFRNDSYFEANCVLTCLGGQYKEYNKKMLINIQQHLRKMKHSVEKLIEKNLRIQGEDYFTKKASLEIVINTFEDHKNWIFDFNYANFKRLSELCSLPCISEDDFALENCFDQICQNNNLMKQIKSCSIDDYKKIKFSLLMQAVKKVFTEYKMSDWVVITPRLEIDGKMVALTQYVTWMYRDFEIDPVENMTDKSFVTLVHQDHFLIDMMLNDISKIFEKVLNRDHNELESIKKDVALLTYEFAHAMPFKRGSAAIAEWLETILYRFHGYELTYNNDKMLNMEALSLSLKDFVENYDSMINLQKNEQH